MEKYELKDNMKEIDALNNELIKYDKLVNDAINELDTLGTNDYSSPIEMAYFAGQSREKLRIKLVKLRTNVFKMPEGMLLKIWEMED